jgi:hypothetical protein
MYVCPPLTTEAMFLRILNERIFDGAEGGRRHQSFAIFSLTLYTCRLEELKDLLAID